MRKGFLPDFSPIATLAAFLAGGFLLYGQTLAHGFVWDDLPQIVHSDVLRSWDHVKDFFFYPHWYLLKGDTVPYYRPMLPILILLTSTWSGIQPSGYHLVSIVLHSLTAWLFYLFLLRLNLKKWFCILTALLFIVHPIAVEPVAWASAATVLLSATCFLITLHLSMTLTNESNSFWHLMGMGSAFLIGLLSYPTLFILPILVVFFRCSGLANQKMKSSKALFTELSVYTLLILGALALRFSSLMRIGRSDFMPHPNPYTLHVIPTFSNVEWLIRPFNVLTRYIESLVYPFDLTPDAYFQATDLSQSAISAFVLFVIVTVILWKKHNKSLVKIAVAFILFPLLPFLNIFDTGGQFSDRYLYLSCLGWSLWMMVGLEALVAMLNRRFRLSFSLATTLFMLPLFTGYTLQTVQHTRIWKNEVTFWAYAVSQSNHKANTHSEYGSALARHGLLDEAMEEFKTAVRLAPQYAWPQQKQADLARDLGYEEKQNPQESSKR